MVRPCYSPRRVVVVRRFSSSFIEWLLTTTPVSLDAYFLLLPFFPASFADDDDDDAPALLTVPLAPSAVLLRSASGVGAGGFGGGFLPGIAATSDPTFSSMSRPVGGAGGVRGTA